ncbi:uncharacterized protein Z518_04876 [Rhinocladiella mackenziei CBS 650.93]|uniref:Rhinocladiella mackenziei CBS 650.93 unplaced genomic scaffold supercont1.3, whole genome shotgun sequence n=1 Tax=Rhinocladiella mackenziei CBS 650.93 TaxID=1442369 RepID=A0A0D2JCQ5_9EURO|nr:uncharacterized protein Z518_04876 [Rhinocladiella mackenziei CBS 650.93]KIX06900.1 hypothetical protein Z518_04876 [Rhinocladiella mackenziei CBS 650.93]
MAYRSNSKSPKFGNANIPRDAQHAPAAQMKPASRSWNGCVRCRKRRQKCGEQKPQCSRCQRDGITCIYERTLRFGGRPFAQSRFGKCLSTKDGGARKAVTTDGGFVYTSVPSPKRVPSKPTLAAGEASFTPVREESATLPSQEANLDTSLDLVHLTTRWQHITIPARIDFFSFIPPNNRALLDYFTCNASMALASHTFVHQEVCKLVLPMVMENPALLYATLALAEIHRTSLISTVDLQIDHGTRTLVTQLTATSIRCLRAQLQQSQSSQLGANLATIRTLFLCEVISGSPTLRAWRAHFMGAQALIMSTERSSGNAPSSWQDSSIHFLRRWYNITEALVALTTEGLSAGQITFPGSQTQPYEREHQEVCIDVYTGCTEDLSVAFREIGAVAWERESAPDNPTQHPKLSEADFLREADILELSVRRIMERDRSRAVLFNVSGAHELSLEEGEEFLLCNEAYQHTALIHIHRRIRRLPPDAPLVQESVRRIIECVDNIKPAATLSPLTLLTTPLFTAGCEAQGVARRKIAHFLTNMFSLLRLPNMKRALEVLETFWRESEASGINWEEFSRGSLPHPLPVPSDRKTTEFDPVNDGSLFSSCFSCDHLGLIDSVHGISIPRIESLVRAIRGEDYWLHPSTAPFLEDKYVGGRQTAQIIA